jgi:hypothetical protein
MPPSWLGRCCLVALALASGGTRRSAHAFSFIPRASETPPFIPARRQVVQSLLGFGTAAMGPGDAAQAARGAAELDLEYYWRDLWGSNHERLGNVGPSPPPAMPAPRTLRDPLRALLLNDACSKDCLPTRVLMDLLSQKKKNSDTRVPDREDAWEATIQQSVEQYRQRASRSFYRRAAWQEAHVSDQYYFDLTAYAFWKTAQDLLPDPCDRDVFQRTLGQSLYQQLLSLQLLTPPNNDKNNTLVATNAQVTELLNLFTDYGLIESYTLEHPHDDDDSHAWFDAYDDADLRQGAAVNAVLRVRSAATLGASLQLTGEQSRFLPDVISPTLCALWPPGSDAVLTTWESYFLDATYRPNPKGTTLYIYSSSSASQALGATTTDSHWQNIRLLSQ